MTNIVHSTILVRHMGPASAFSKIALFAGILATLSCGTDNKQQNVLQLSLPRIQHSVTTSKTGFPQSLYMYHSLDGANSPAEIHALSGTISLKNHSSNFSEVLWTLAYWKGECPENDVNLKGAKPDRPATPRRRRLVQRVPRIPHAGRDT